MARATPTSRDAEIDLRERDAAVEDDAALVAYERKWRARLERLQRAHRSRWRVRGLSDDEVRDELLLRLVDAIRTKPEERARHLRDGKEWGLVFLAHARRALASSFRLHIVPADVTPTLDRAPTEEERLIEAQHDAVRAVARERAESALTKPQRRWLSAMKMSANAGSFFASSGELNLAAVSRVLDKDRSSAHRAFEEISDRFCAELDKLED
jgi:hypothetical protein